ncbi:MAG TPA: ABC transporter ATP-binding protein [Candidatus Saccharimonadales bacterium]|nr:ABC transporter ATP-binding protein [Candidatus Saccharimonadales bacterium]
MSNPIKDNQVANYYWRRANKYRRLVLGILFSIPLTVLVNNYLPALIVASVLSSLSQHHFHAHNVWQSYGPILVAYATLILGGVFTWRIVDRFMWRLEANVLRDISEEVFNHLMEESADFHANNFTGSLVSQTNKLTNGYVRVADTTVFQVYPLISGLVIVSVILATRAPLFVVLLISFAAFYLFSAIKISKPVQKRSKAFAATESKQTGFLADAIANVMAIKSFGRGHYERKRFNKATTDTYNHLFLFAGALQRQLNILGVLSRGISSVALLMAVVSVVIFGANIGTVFLILSYTSSIVEQLFQFSNNSLRSYSRAFGDATDMVEILAEQPSVQDPVKPEKVHVKDGEIEFNNVTFTHAGADDAIFERLNLKLKPGEKIGLVGHSGSGKTTITRLLLRFSDLDGGQILIDGQNIANITQDDLHNYIAFVPQEPLLFHRSIADNISYGNIDAPHSEIERVAKYAHADEFIENLPRGYETLVGERGVKLSGGQRQRVAIARAMLKNAPILVLDEATSALDSESEVLIQDALWKLMEGRTAIVIAHRLSTIQKMDRIIVLDNGRVVEQGSHKELLARDGTYARLWAHQSGGFIEDEE